MSARRACRPLVVAMLIVAVLAACASVRFEGTESRLVIDARDALLPQYLGLTGTVVWGGRIIEVANLETTTELLILALPLSGGNVPLIEKNSVGRFVARVDGFLEPLDYAPGRYVSLAGQLAGLTGDWQNEEQVVELPVVDQGRVHLWPRDPSTWQPRISVGIGIGIHN